MPVFTDLINKGRTSQTSSGLKNKDWFRAKAQTVMSANPTRLINTNMQNQTPGIQPGNMYLFGYDAKTKDQLPYFDRFPLVFPVSAEPESFIGLNLHYLPHILRARLMDALYDLAESKKYTEANKLNLSYQILKSSSRYKYFEPCVKKYLFSHVRTRFLMIPSNEWDIALFLPLERFTVNKQKVYNDSLRNF